MEIIMYWTNTILVAFLTIEAVKEIDGWRRAVGISAAWFMLGTVFGDVLKRLLEFYNG